MTESVPPRKSKSTGRNARTDAVAKTASKKSTPPAADITMGQPLELVVLACKPRAILCRPLGGASELTLHVATHSEVPGEIVSVVPMKLWKVAGRAHLSAEIVSRRDHIRAIGLTPLEFEPLGEWDPKKVYWGEEGQPIDEWAKPIIARGKRPLFEMEQVVPGVDPANWEYDPILEASARNAAGQVAKARELLMDLLAKDLRCLDAHAHLGNFEFDDCPEQALRHYQVGVDIGEFSAGRKIAGVLPWGLIDNRPFLRCLIGLGLCGWRIGMYQEAAVIFRKMLWLNPSDNQGARYSLAAIESGREWEAEP